ncbi:hypothetical protein EIN_345830 [Entamoeba invadens IP1]|uniref:Uncharacterized protein n=1 Tax=Entamoeba invadens IP1 TaxID=370355 RepID=L7FJA5_ENTIV|nr:hypothetical protein EIN_345830 [Entamoeba invadens IP1]ELP83997.1 hypothetical protein EIN_345830 [Entamoeba invadens IP1]|eukprot:XP_004183343.1 hypothetical protein EIN_345830 [Entamoeba invadens IP1]
MDITKQFQQAVEDEYIEAHESEGLPIETIRTQFKQLVDSSKPVESSDINEQIKNIQREIAEKEKGLKKLSMAILTGEVDIYECTSQNSAGRQLSQWANDMEQKITQRFSLYKTENKTKVFAIKHFDIVADQLKDKIFKLQKQANNETKIMWNIVNLNNELLFKRHPELFNETSQNSLQNNTEKSGEEESTTQQQQQLPQAQPKSLECTKANEKTNDTKPVHIEQSIFDDFDDDIPHTEEQPLIVTKPTQNTIPIKTRENNKQTEKVRASEIVSQKVEVDFDGVWDENSEQDDEIKNEENKILKQSQSRMDDVLKGIVEKITNINELNTKIGEMAQIQLENTQHIVDAVEEAQVAIVVGNKALTEAHEMMKSWWTPKKLAGMLFFIAGLLLLINHFGTN